MALGTGFQIISPENADFAAFSPLWQAYLGFYRHDLPEAVTDLTWQRFFDPDEPMHLLAAAEGRSWLGFVTVITHRSTWASRHYCYLEDLYVAEEARGRGVARALIEGVADLAREQGAERLYWMTDKTNHTAQALYNKIAKESDFMQYVKAL
jgi:GNAT superfamily N-acetyltransferase